MSQFPSPDFTPRGNRPAPFSLRLTPQERAELERLAGDMSLSAFIKDRVFDPDNPHPRRRRRRSVADHKALAQAMAMLGSSRLSQNMNQLAKATHTGNLPLPDQVARELERGCADIRAIREMLMRALGIPIPKTSKRRKQSTSLTFAQEAADTRENS